MWLLFASYIENSGLSSLLSFLKNPQSYTLSCSKRLFRIICFFPDVPRKYFVPNILSGIVFVNNCLLRTCSSLPQTSIF